MTARKNLTLELASAEIATRAEARGVRKLQFTVDQETATRLEESRQANGDSSLVQTFRRAVALLAFVDRMRREGFDLAVVRDGEVRHVVMP